MEKLGKKFCRLYVVRHGETVWNREARIQGHTDSSLTSKGIQQAKTIARLLQKQHFAKIFSSDLSRAYKTAEIIALEKKMTVESTKVLRERFFGRFEGIQEQEFKQRLKKQLEKLAKLSGEEQKNFSLDPDIETDSSAVSRLLTFLRKISLAYQGKQVLIVSHGGLMRVLLIHLGFASYAQLPRGSIENTGFVVLDSDGVDFFIRKTFGVNKKI